MKPREEKVVMAQQENKQMVIDYFEFTILVEASWHVSTILRHSVIVKAMDTWYHALSKNDRQRAFELFSRIVEVKEEIHHRFMARFNPELQFRVSLSNGTMEDVADCYLFEGEYWTSSFQLCESEYIQNVEKI